MNWVERALATTYTAPPEEHGGGLDAARLRYPNAPKPWLDLSTGVSPLAYPLPEIAHEAWTKLPDVEARDLAESAAAKAYGAPRFIETIAGAGSQAFIRLIPWIFVAQRVSVLGFTYSEHAVAWRVTGARVETATSLADLTDAEVAIVVNPNNPDGRRVPPSALLRLARSMSARGGLLIVDEAFVDFTPDASLVPLLEPDDRIVVLRSFGKAYGLPGLRLGFAMCGPYIAERLRAAQGPWAVSGPALALAAEALRDEAWLESSRAYAQEAVLELDEMLTAARFAVVGGTSLFRLAESEAPQSWHERLCRAGILTRRFRDRPRWLRFGLPGDRAEWARLAQALGLAEHV
jgi:cobalamin biosynthetic protein CobC